MSFEIYKEKKVLITGNTGFKGAWLTAWLLNLGAQIIGFSKDIPTQPSMFNELGLIKKIKHVQGDVRDLSSVQKLINDEKPDFVFHLAAQAIVSVSYSDPSMTVSTNVVGTLNILEALRKLEHKCTAVIITSDKCYDNVEWIWGYRENDKLGGKDVYSGSKGAAELIIKSYVHSFFDSSHPVNIAVGRAGNVIGGGDWAKDRIVVDCIRAWSEGLRVDIRSPKATRPWQHVLEPLSGYLSLGKDLKRNESLNGEAFNFGPKSGQNHTVERLLKDLSRYWGFSDMDQACHISDEVPFHEAGLLNLNCDKALTKLKWEPNLNYNETIQYVGEWYRLFYDGKDMFEITLDQINEYSKIAVSRNRIWS